LIREMVSFRGEPADGSRAALVRQVAAGDRLDGFHQWHRWSNFIALFVVEFLGGNGSGAQGFLLEMRFLGKESPRLHDFYSDSTPPGASSTAPLFLLPAEPSISRRTELQGQRSLSTRTAPLLHIGGSDRCPARTGVRQFLKQQQVGRSCAASSISSSAASNRNGYGPDFLEIDRIEFLECTPLWRPTLCSASLGPSGAFYFLVRRPRHRGRCQSVVRRRCPLLAGSQRRESRKGGAPTLWVLPEGLAGKPALPGTAFPESGFAEEALVVEVFLVVECFDAAAFAAGGLRVRRQPVWRPRQGVSAVWARLPPWTSSWPLSCGNPFGLLREAFGFASTLPPLLPKGKRP